MPPPDETPQPAPPPSLDERHLEAQAVLQQERDRITGARRATDQAPLATRILLGKARP